MAQNLATDFPIDPATTSGSQLADVLNRFEQAINSCNRGATAPPDTYAGMLWLDTTTGTEGTLKIRNAANGAWLSVMNMGSGQGYLPLTGGVLTGNVSQQPASGGAYYRVMAVAGQSAVVNIGANGNAANVASFDLYQIGTTNEAVIRNMHATAAMRFQTGGANNRFTINADGTMLFAGASTFTGNVAISKATPDFALNKAASGQSANISFQTAGSLRWTITGSNTTAESGSNAGSDFSIGAIADNGSTGLGTRLLMERKANGAIYLGNNGKDNAISFVYADYGGGAIQWEALVRSTVGGACLNVDAKKDAINSATVKLMKDGKNRWTVFASNAAESSGNLGSNFGIARSDDAGLQIDIPLNIARSTGIVTIKTSLFALELADEEGNVTGSMMGIIDQLKTRLAALEAA